MTELVLHSHPDHFSTSPTPTTSSSSSSSPPPSLTSAPPSSLTCAPPRDESWVTDCDARQQLSLLALLVTFFRKSLSPCKRERRELCAMEIGWPTNVRHVAHVTFDRFNGFLGLPVEFEPELPSRPPSASRTVFGVSTKSMQLSYDSRGNSVPTILLLMQGRLYAEGGLQVEGIFRINGENSQEEHIRGQLNRGDVPEGIDIHCLAGLIKAWFRELPVGLLDSLAPEQVMQCQTEDDCLELVRLLPSTEVALLDWAVNLMADVVKHEHLNKMNARNIAMVFAPNMTQMADPLTALMYAVQVMNFLKILILKTLQERKENVVEARVFCVEPADENGHQSCLQSCHEDVVKESLVENPIPNGRDCCGTSDQVDTLGNEMEAVNTMTTEVQGDSVKSKPDQLNNSTFKMGPERISDQQAAVWGTGPVEKARKISNLNRIDSRRELIEAWR
ncbi:putative Rho GTPase activation protein [Rosa chinensis]|uniref:Putative Rho GTPase activation protein n=2 Tax=Rosa chinensis TaxID=74649 RepID=A0A2P6QDW4_ROSCH|nr:rho GTPase-activating protein 5 isoform X1 [Rosa chinensis]PRQ32373.1 putative Rho GTPase activation protein [Rosa chinensis]